MRKVSELVASCLRRTRVTYATPCKLPFSPIVACRQNADQLRISGGLGLTGGIADVGSLVDCLVGIHKGLASDSILDHYDRERRDIYDKVTNPVSTENLKRLNRQDPEKALENDEFFKMCLKGEADTVFSRNLQLVSLPVVLFVMIFPLLKEEQGVKDMLQHDFTQYYDQKQANGTVVTV